MYIYIYIYTYFIVIRIPTNTPCGARRRQAPGAFEAERGFRGGGLIRSSSIL